LEDVVAAVVAVPILVAQALEVDAKLETAANFAHDLGAIDGEAELVGEPVTGSGQVGARYVSVRVPVVRRVPDLDLLVKVKVDDANDPLDEVIAVINVS